MSETRAAFEQGVQEERERIIKILKANMPLVLQQQFIELIKGDK